MIGRFASKEIRLDCRTVKHKLRIIRLTWGRLHATEEEAAPHAFVPSLCLKMSLLAI